MTIKDAVYVYRLVGGDRLSWHGRYHTHGPNDYEFHIFLEGQGAFLLNRTRYRIEGNRLFLTRPREFHSILSEALEKPISYYAFLFEVDPLLAEDQKALELIRRSEQTQQKGVVIEGRTRFLLEELYFLSRAKEAANNRAAEYLLLSLIYQWYNNGNEPMDEASGSDINLETSGHSHKKNDHIERALQRMEKSIQEKMNTKDLAEEIGLSEEHFIRLFRKHLGMSPFQYFTRLKVEAASAYLVESFMPIKTISDYFGFENPFHFSRVFKKCTGLSPHQYRRTYSQRV
ncbi:helix-turn-helix domain-containing protein [Gracilinema caldarium]|uniref:AraC family transcriptional regulator n=1 Tax=Gracilinema caldarium TaxID=215591 RepID=UPI0026E9D939|nr:helix-turn-helix domain-containing protein [Gracilinema caldarium]